MRLIWKLLRKHISIFELAVFFIANLIGLVVILAGVQIYSDAKPLMNGGEESLIGSDYVAISKVVESTGKKSDDNGFSEEEIEKILQQEGVINVGRFTASNFEVRSKLDLGQTPFTTLMFFESVPDQFIDVDLDEWQVDIEEVKSRRQTYLSAIAMDDQLELRQLERKKPITIPIIIPRNYLNLFNFGFSRTIATPVQLSEEGLQEMEMDLEIVGTCRDTISGRITVARTDKYVGKIMGLSDRINTILVPQQFMEWANEYYVLPNTEVATEEGEGVEGEKPSRLILEVKNPSDPSLIAFLDENNYVSEGEPSESGKAMVILQRSVAVVVAIGILFCLLSIIILTLSIYLLLQKNIDKLENLVLIGHTPMMVSMPYIIMTLVLNISIMVASFVIIALGRAHFLIPVFEDFLGTGVTTSMAPTYITGVILTVAIVAFNIFIIYHKVNQISRKR